MTVTGFLRKIKTGGCVLLSLERNEIFWVRLIHAASLELSLYHHIPNHFLTTGLFLPSKSPLPPFSTSSPPSTPPSAVATTPPLLVVPPTLPVSSAGPIFSLSVLTVQPPNPSPPSNPCAFLYSPLLTTSSTFLFLRSAVSALTRAE